MFILFYAIIPHALSITWPTRIFEHVPRTPCINSETECMKKPQLKPIKQSIPSTSKMKREGRQHGIVRTNQILPDALQKHTPRFVNPIDTRPTAGMFTKVSSKPTGMTDSRKSKQRNNHKDKVAIFDNGVYLIGVSQHQ